MLETGTVGVPTPVMMSVGPGNVIETDGVGTVGVEDVTDGVSTGVVDCPPGTPPPPLLLQPARSVTAAAALTAVPMAIFILALLVDQVRFSRPWIFTHHP